MRHEHAAAREIEQLSLSLHRVAIEDARSHRAGGEPWGIAPRGLPHCDDCGRNMSFVAQVDLADPVLGLQLPHASHLVVVTCFGCDADTLGTTHYVRSKSGLSLRLRQRSAATAVGPEIGSSSSCHEIEFGEASAASFEGPFHQWGGQPLWLEESVEPRCTQCKTPMTFVMQLDSDDHAGIRFADNGMLYAFACVTCGEIATTVQTA